MASRTKAVFGSLQHVTDYLTSNINRTSCDGPSQYERQKNYNALTISSDTVKIPVSRFEADGCIWMSVQVGLTGTTGTLGCAYASSFDGEVIGSIQW